MIAGENQAVALVQLYASSDQDQFEEVVGLPGKRRDVPAGGLSATQSGGQNRTVLRQKALRVLLGGRYVLLAPGGCGFHGNIRGRLRQALEYTF